MRKYLTIGIPFALVTVPGALNAWLSLIERFLTDGEGRVAISLGASYESVFPILGLGILLFGVWWTRDRQQTSTSERSLSRTNDLDSSTTSETRHIEHPSPTAHTPSTFIEDSVTDLCRKFEGLTSIEAKPLVESCVGNQLVVTGTVDDVSERRGGYHISLDVEGGPTSIHTYFNKEWSEFVRNLHKDDAITVIGEIQEIDSYGVRLISCQVPKAISG